MLAETGNLTEIVFFTFWGNPKKVKKTRNISQQIFYEINVENMSLKLN